MRTDDMTTPRTTAHKFKWALGALEGVANGEERMDLTYTERQQLDSVIFNLQLLTSGYMVRLERMEEHGETNG